MDGHSSTDMVERLGAKVDEYRENGVIHLPGALDTGALARLQEIYAATLSAPSPSSISFYPESGATFIQDLGNTGHWDDWAEAVRASSIPDILASLWGTENVWFYYEQVFLKEGGKTRRTPWHQDSSYLPVAGDQIANVWISFDPVAKTDALEFVRGSHRGPMYSPSAFDANDDTAPLDPSSSLPRLPDIEAARDRWDVISWAVEPGDIIIFHIALLHGGAATQPGGRRRTVALRCFGDDARLEPRSPSTGAGTDGPELLRIHDQIEPGQQLASHRAFPQLRHGQR